MEEFVPLAIALVAAVGSVVAAVTAGRYANRAQTSQAQEARIRDLEECLSKSREEVYTPMLELLREVLDSSKTGKDPMVDPKSQETFSRFGSWVQIYGSDEAIRVVHKFMQSAYAGAPSQVLMRYYAELTLAVRRDLGDPDTEVDLVTLLGIRINGIHKSDLVETMDMEESGLLAKHGWAPPWGSRFTVDSPGERP